MSALYGRLEGNRGSVTRCGSKKSGIIARLNTWESSVECHLGVDNVLRINTKNDMKVYVNNENVIT